MSDLVKCKLCGSYSPIDPYYVVTDELCDECVNAIVRERVPFIKSILFEIEYDKTQDNDGEPTSS